MSHTHDVHAGQTTNNAGSLMQGHPRGRGFTILSRLARGDAAPGHPAGPPAAHATAPQPAPEVAPQEDQVEWTAPVIPLDRPQPTPRHRRDDADDESADFDVSVVPVARRSS
jgi:hypothetical protein